MQSKELHGINNEKKIINRVVTFVTEKQRFSSHGASGCRYLNHHLKGITAEIFFDNVRSVVPWPFFLMTLVTLNNYSPSCFVSICTVVQLA